MPERAFSFLELNQWTPKPRTGGLTEISGPYYTPSCKRHLEDIFEATGEYIDSLKFAGESFSLMSRPAVIEFLKICYDHDVLVSTGGFLEYVLTKDPESISKSSMNGLKPKPEIGIQFGAGGATRAEDLEAAGFRDPEWPIQLTQQFLDACAYLIMIESEGITENVKTWRTDVPARIGKFGLEKVMFEAADPEIFAWYIKNYGPEVNLFVNHSQIVQLECVRSGIWGTADIWGRILTYKEQENSPWQRNPLSLESITER